MDGSVDEIPILDVTPLVSGAGNQWLIAQQIGQACRQHGFFYIVGHGVDALLQERLVELSRAFFAQPLETKQEIRMARGGRAWRGYFPVGAELTSGRADLKEGIYFGSELSVDHPLVVADTPLHGPNLFPAVPSGLRRTVLDYMAAMTHLGHALMRGIALSLDLEACYFDEHYTAEPLVLFRLFNYPAAPLGDESAWGVGEHTDYGVLTILKQDDSGGLEVKSHSRWIEAAPVSNSFVCNIGDMLDRMTGGRYRSTPHRVRNRSGRDRLSFPFFFDPNFHAAVHPLPLPHAPLPPDDRNDRWDGESVHEFRGTYGEYLLRKVSKVFPELRRAVL